MKGLTTQRLGVLFIAFALILQYPLLRPSDSTELVAGVPRLYLHVLLGWLLLIGLIALVMADKHRRSKEQE